MKIKLEREIVATMVNFETSLEGLGLELLGNMAKALDSILATAQ